MSNQDNSFLHRPRETIQCVLIGLCCLWQLGVGLLGFFCFLTFVRWLRYSVGLIVLVGVLLAGWCCLLMEWQAHFTLSFLEIIHTGFVSHLMFWKIVLTQGLLTALKLTYQQDFYYLLGFPLLFAGLLGLTEWIPNSTYEWELKAIQRGRKLPDRPHWKKQRFHGYPRFIKNKNEQYQEGTLLGMSTNQKAVIIPDKAINQMVLVLGTTGGGKTVTLRRFYQRALQQAYPLIIIDGKPTQENVRWLQQRAQTSGRTFYGFNCADHQHYDPLAYGGCTELKDKLISLKDHWENDYYRSVAEDYLQTTFEVLLNLKANFDLKTIVDCLDFKEVALKVRAIADESLKKRVLRLQQYDIKDITGLQAHLSLLIHSELGHFFEKNEKQFNLAQIIQSGSVVYFALPALRFPSFAKVLGKLIINDIKAVIDRLET